MIDNKLPGHIFAPFYIRTIIWKHVEENAPKYEDVYTYPGQVMVHATYASFAQSLKFAMPGSTLRPYPSCYISNFFFAMDTNIHIIPFSLHVSTYFTFYKCTEPLKLSPKQKSPAVWFDNFLSSSLSRRSFLFMTVTLHHTNLQCTTYIIAPHSDITEV